MDEAEICTDGSAVLFLYPVLTVEWISQVESLRRARLPENPSRRGASENSANRTGPCVERLSFPLLPVDGQHPLFPLALYV